MRGFARMLMKAAAMILALVGVLFAWCYYAFYWVLRDCFNADGGCMLAGEGVVHHDSSFVYGPMAVACWAASYAIWRARKRQSTNNTPL
ncbi:MAG: hypothetical protein DI582_05735 [Azospirillum brasilense]|nr:MAG: hypothetical protein DI582_05735 [Azospirillum brasilense]